MNWIYHSLLYKGNSFLGKGKLSVLLHKTKISMRKSICLAIILAVFCMEEVPAQKIAKTKEIRLWKLFWFIVCIKRILFAYFRLWMIWIFRRPAGSLIRLFISCLFPPTFIMKLPIKRNFWNKMESGYENNDSCDSLYMGKRDSASAAIYQLPDLETWPLPTVGRIIY